MSESTEQSKEFKLFGDLFIYKAKTNKSKCLLSNCNKELCGSKPSNLKRHVTLMHKDFIGKIIVNKCKKCFEETDILDAFVEWFTINGRPFSIIEDSAFKKMFQYLLFYHELISGEKITIDLTKIKERMEEIVPQMRGEIVAETKNIPISFMMDLAKKNHSAILGVNVQYTLNDKVVVRTLDMVRMNERKTGKNIAAAVGKVFFDFEIIWYDKQILFQMRLTKEIFIFHN